MNGYFGPYLPLNLTTKSSIVKNFVPFNGGSWAPICNRRGLASSQPRVHPKAHRREPRMPLPRPHCPAFRARRGGFNPAQG